jgi:hypothetical protein
VNCSVKGCRIGQTTGRAASQESRVEGCQLQFGRNGQGTVIPYHFKGVNYSLRFQQLQSANVLVNGTGSGPTKESTATADANNENEIRRLKAENTQYKQSLDLLVGSFHWL